MTPTEMTAEELAPRTEDEVRAHLAAGKLVEGLQHMSPEYLKGMRRILTVSADTELVESIERLEKPVVAAVDGVVTGAGLALALACDWRVGSPRARVLFREGRVGLVPSHGGLTRLVKLLGLARAKEVLLGGEDLDAETAHAAGLLSELAGSGDDVLAVARARVDRMLVRAPLSFAAAKRLLQLAADVDLHSGMLAETMAQSALLRSHDHREGLAAARERREPDFRGS